MALQKQPWSRRSRPSLSTRLLEDGFARRADEHIGGGKIPEHFYAWFWGFVALAAVLLAIYYWRMDGDQLEILKELVVSVVPLGVLTVVVLAVILFGITTATESAAIGALEPCIWRSWPSSSPGWWWSLVGAIIGVVMVGLAGAS